jgi:hypothetical protein
MRRTSDGRLQGEEGEKNPVAAPGRQDDQRREEGPRGPPQAPEDRQLPRTADILMPVQVPIIPGAVTVVLDGSGNGTARIGPAGARETWFPAVASVSAATAVKEAQCRIYVGPAAAPQYFIDGTLSGSTGDSTDRVASQPVPLGSFIWAVWAGGDAGSVATLNVTGTRTV